MNSYNPFSLEGKKILVTGASSGIGRAIAIECSRMGASVIITARNKERLQETLDMMECPERHLLLTADMAVDDDINQLVDGIEDGLDGIVLCAGFTIVKPFKFVSDKDVDAIMDVNYKAPVVLTQRLLKKKRINKKASIVFISSVSGVFV